MKILSKNETVEYQYSSEEEMIKHHDFMCENGWHGMIYNKKLLHASYYMELVYDQLE